MGWNLGRLPGLYAIAAAIVGLNVLLFYQLLWRLWPDRQFATVSAALFALFPADSCFPMLHINFHCRLAITILLLAVLAYLQGSPGAGRWRVCSYLLILVVLLYYEASFLCF